MKTFSDFILEARGSSDEKLIQTRGKIELLRAQMSSTNDPTKKEELKKQIRKLQSLLPTPGKGRPQKNVDTRGRSGSLPNIPSSAGENSGTSVGGRFGDRGSGKPGSTLRDKGTGRSGGHLGVKHP